MKPFFVMLACASCLDAAAVMRGKLVRNHVNGDPVVGVSVTAPGAANPTLSSDDGAFSLEFPNRQAGDRVRIEPAYSGFEVVNWPQLNVVLARDYQGSNLLIIILARAAERQEMAARFFLNLSISAIERQHQQRVQQAGQYRARLLRELEQAKALANQTAQELAKIQPGQSSPLFEEAMRFVAEGKMNEALQTLDETNLKARTQEAKARREAAEKQLRETARDWALRGSLLATQFRFAEAETAYRSAIETAPDDFESRFDFACFLQELKRHQAAREQFERCLSLARSQSDSGRIAKTLNNLGNLHSDQNRMDEARKAYEEALAISRKLAASNPDTYLPYVATTLNNLGVLHRDQNRMEEARKVYEEALAISRRLAASNPDAYLPDVALNLNNLGILHSNQNRTEDAEKAYQESLASYRKLAASDSDAYLPYVAAALNNLGILHSDQNRPEAAENAYKEALAIRRKLAASNPDAYLSDLGTTLNNLGNLLSDHKRMEEAKTAYEEALASYRKLAAFDPDAYLPYVAGTLNNLGALQRDQQRPEDARKAYEEALASYRKLAASNSDTYLPYVAMALNNLGELHSDEKRMEEAQTAYKEALAIRRKLAAADPDTHLPDLARVLWGIGRMRLALRDWKQAEAALTEALGIFTKFAQREPAQYGPLLRLVKEDLAKVPR